MVQPSTIDKLIITFLNAYPARYQIKRWLSILFRMMITRFIGLFAELFDNVEYVIFDNDPSNESSEIEIGLDIRIYNEHVCAIYTDNNRILFTLNSTNSTIYRVNPVDQTLVFETATKQDLVNIAFRTADVIHRLIIRYL